MELSSSQSGQPELTGWALGSVGGEGIGQCLARHGEVESWKSLQSRCGHSGQSGKSQCLAESWKSLQSHLAHVSSARSARGAGSAGLFVGKHRKDRKVSDALGALLPAEAEGKVCAEADQPPHPVGLAEDVFVNASNASTRR